MRFGRFLAYTIMWSMRSFYGLWRWLTGSRAHRAMIEPESDRRVEGDVPSHKLREGDFMSMDADEERKGTNGKNKGTR